MTPLEQAKEDIRLELHPDHNDFDAIDAAVERLILSEREACAQIAGEVRTQRHSFDSSGASIASLIETRIRSRS